MSHRARLAVDRMTTTQLWSALSGHLDALDPMSFRYFPGQTHNTALQAREIMLELRLRSTQLSLFESHPNDAA